LNRGKANSFTGKYYCYHLLYFEKFQWLKDAIKREKELKGWIRDKKMNLIKEENPKLLFLNHQVCSKWPPGEEATIRNA